MRRHPYGPHRSALPVLVLCLGLQAATVAGLTPRGIAIEQDGSIVVVGFGTDYEVIRIDPVTGVATTVSSSTVGSGPSLDTVEDVAVEPSGSLAVTLPFIGFQKVLRVDAVSGDRSILSDETVGSGPSIFPKSIAAAGGALFVTEDQEFGDPGIVRVDPSTGDRFIVSGPSRGGGPAVKAPTGIAVEPGGSLVVTEQLLEAVVRVDPATGDRTIVSDAHTGSGPPLPWVVAITATPDGTLLVADRGGDRFCVPFCPSELRRTSPWRPGARTWSRTPASATRPCCAWTLSPAGDASWPASGPCRPAPRRASNAVSRSRPACIDPPIPKPGCAARWAAPTTRWPCHGRTSSSRGCHRRSGAPSGSASTPRCSA